MSRNTPKPLGNCEDKVRCSLSDDDGVLAFKSFEIVGDSPCRAMGEQLRDYLVGRPLAEVDLDYVRSFKCAGPQACTNSVVRMIEEYQDLFVCADD